jgi:hypothetical protein
MSTCNNPPPPIIVSLQASACDDHICQDASITLLHGYGLSWRAAVSVLTVRQQNRLRHKPGAAADSLAASHLPHLVPALVRPVLQDSNYFNLAIAPILRSMPQQKLRVLAELQVCCGGAPAAPSSI